MIHFTFSKRDELGDLQNIVLIVELMGRHSTIVLVNQSSGKILDAIKHIGMSKIVIVRCFLEQLILNRQNQWDLIRSRPQRRSLCASFYSS